MDADTWTSIQPLWSRLVTVAKRRWDTIGSLLWNPKREYCDAHEQERLLDAVSLGPVNVMSILSSWAAEFRAMMIKTEALKRKSSGEETLPESPRLTRSRAANSAAK